MVKRVAGSLQLRPSEQIASGRAGSQVRRSSLFVLHGHHVETNGMLMFAPRPDDCDLVQYQNLHVPPVIIRQRARLVAVYCPIGWSEVDVRRDDRQGALAAETASVCRCDDRVVRLLGVTIRVLAKTPLATAFIEMIRNVTFE